MHKLRVKYSERGPVRFMSHLELTQTLQRAFRRAALPLAFSQGFSPKPKLSWGPPLAVGYQSTSEFLDLQLTKRIGAEKIIKEINSLLPEGLKVLEAKYIPANSPSLSSALNIVSYEIVVKAPPLGNKENLVELISGLKKKQQVKIEKRGKRVLINLNQAIVDVATNLVEDKVAISLKLLLGKEGIRPEQFIKLLEKEAKPRLSLEILEINRDGLFYRDGIQLLSPI